MIRIKNNKLKNIMIFVLLFFSQTFSHKFEMLMKDYLSQLMKDIYFFNKILFVYDFS